MTSTSASSSSSKIPTFSISPSSPAETSTQAQEPDTTPTLASSLPADSQEDSTFVPHPTSQLADMSLDDPNTNGDPRKGARLHSSASKETISANPSSSSSSALDNLGPVVVISGGSGWNSLVNCTPSNTTHCIPVSDDGGSSSEIIRVLGGPSIGDLRSRLVRLIPLPPTESTLNSPTLPSNQSSSTSINPQAPIPHSNYAVHQLLSYRLPSKGQTKVIKQEWLEILEGKHRLWKGIEPERKEVIRGFLVQFQSEVLRRSHRNFEFRGMSVGNAFLTASQKFFRSIQSAIFLFSVTTQMHLSSSKVLPIINTNHTATIAAELENEEIVVGQCEISHPIRNRQPSTSTSNPSSQFTDGSYFNSNQASGSNSGNGSWVPGTPSSQIFDPFSNPRNYLNVDSHSNNSTAIGGRPPLPSPSLLAVGNSGDGLDPEQEDDEDFEEMDDGLIQDDEGLGDGADSSGAKKNGKGQSRGNVFFDKDFNSEEDQLRARIRRIFYVNAYRHEVFPRPNPEVISSLSQSKTLIYSCGSLYTSIMPCLVLRGVATSIAKSSSLKAKVLLLNTVHDRETRGLDAVDFLKAITESLNRSDSPPILDKNGNLNNQFPRAIYQTRDFVTHLIYFEEGEIKVDLERMKELGVTCVKATKTPKEDIDSSGKLKPPSFDEQSVKQALEHISKDVLESEKSLSV